MKINSKLQGWLKISKLKTGWLKMILKTGWRFIFPWFWVFSLQCYLAFSCIFFLPQLTDKIFFEGKYDCCQLPEIHSCVCIYPHVRVPCFTLSAGFLVRPNNDGSLLYAFSGRNFPVLICQQLCQSIMDLIKFWTRNEASVCIEVLITPELVRRELIQCRSWRLRFDLYPVYIQKLLFDTDFRIIP